MGEIVKAGAQLVILGTGNRQLEKKLAEISKQYPGQVSVTLCFDAKLAHQIYAGSDFFLMPSRFEPCGLGQLIAMRYGTVPIVRATGGLRDTIKNVIFKNNKIKGTGFVFHLPNSERLLATIKRGLEFYQRKRLWKQIVINDLQQDFSWGKSAKQYYRLYQQLIIKQ